MESQSVVLKNVANLFGEPGSGGELVTQAIIGTSLTIEERTGGWYYVQLPDRYRAWIEADQIREYAQGEAPYASAGKVAEVQELLAFLHQRPDDTSRGPDLPVR